MAKCNQLTPLPFKGLTSQSNYKMWPTLGSANFVQHITVNSATVLACTCQLYFLRTSTFSKDVMQNGHNT